MFPIDNKKSDSINQIATNFYRFISIILKIK